jgi:hypothetical protein
MAIKVKRAHPKHLSLRQLETALQLSESGSGGLTALSVDGESTVSTHDMAVRTPVQSLILLPDPHDDEAGPSGSTLVSRGEVYASGQLTKVAAFRKTDP